MRKFIKILIIAVSVIAVLVAAFFILGYKMVADIQSTYETINPLDLKQVPDGVYHGTGGEFIVGVDLEVTVKDHRIISIDIISQTSASKYKALETIPRIISSQSASVDAVSGATSSSKSIMAAVYNAIKNG